MYIHLRKRPNSVRLNPTTEGVDTPRTYYVSTITVSESFFTFQIGSTLPTPSEGIIYYTNINLPPNLSSTLTSYRFCKLLESKSRRTVRVSEYYCLYSNNVFDHKGCTKGGKFSIHI